MKDNYAKGMENKGFLPINSEYSEEMYAEQEEVENNPTRYIIEECIPACQELCLKKMVEPSFL